MSFAVALSMVEQAAKPLARPVRVSSTATSAKPIADIFLLFFAFFLNILCLERYGSLMLLLAKFVLEEMAKITLPNLLSSSEECLHRLAFKSYLRKPIILNTFLVLGNCFMNHLFFSFIC